MSERERGAGKAREEAMAPVRKAYQEALSRARKEAEAQAKRGTKDLG